MTPEVGIVLRGVGGIYDIEPGAASHLCRPGAGLSRVSLLLRETGSGILPSARMRV